MIPKPSISIIIPVRDDKAIAKCIRSIDEPDAEILIVLNGSSRQFEKYVDLLTRGDKRTRVLKIKGASIGMARNDGCFSAKSNKLIMMDSDCVFQPNSIRLLKETLNNGDVAKGEVRYEHTGFQTKVVGRAREVHSSDVRNAYTPMLAFRKSIRDKVGGYYFSPAIPWTEDHELAQRIQKNRIKVIAVRGAFCQHRPTTISRDLRSAINYGIGYQRGIAMGLTEPSFLYGGAAKLSKSIWLDLKRFLCLPTYFISILREAGVIVALYMCVWIITFSLSYNIAFIKSKL